VALPAQHADVVKDFDGFLTQAVVWAEAQYCSSTTHDGLAITAICKASDVFGGISVYTVLELFFKACMFSPNIVQ
jgi:hypothetical protein